MPTLTLKSEEWPIAGRFAISRGVKRQAHVVVAELTDGSFHGRGECVPYARYGETSQSVLSILESMKPEIAAGLTRTQLQEKLPPGAARNALDCAFWDLQAKQSGKRAWDNAGIKAPEIVETAFTLSLNTPPEMAKAATKIKASFLKLKLAGDSHDVARVKAVHAAAPQSRLILDANEGFQPPDFADFLNHLQGLNVVLIEQPLKAEQDEALLHITRTIPIAADESCHTRADLTRLRGRYNVINIKLDKTGGLTEALALAKDARAFGFSIMVGCMVASSLAMAPALLLASQADFIDLDGPLLLATDRKPGLHYEGMHIHPPLADVWG